MKSAIAIRRRDSGTELVESSELEQCVEHVLLPGPTTAWNQATLMWNGMAAKQPAVVVQPTSVAEVAAIVTFARDRGLLLSVRGGGHNIAGTSIADGGLTVDMARLRAVSVDVEGRRVHAGPGCVLADVDAATQEHGLATVLGFVSDTGIAGLTLGGGFGHLTRRFGWTVDNLIEAEVVTADGTPRIANEAEHTDLFWAIRGGSGNFGIVTRFTYALHRVGPTVTGGLTAWSAEHIDEVLTAYQRITATSPRELTLAAIVRMAPPAPFIPQPWHGKRIVSMFACYTGDDPDGALAPLRSLSSPIASTLQRLPYTALQSMLNAMEPKGLHRYWKSEFVAEVSKDFLGAFREAAMRVTSPLSQSLIFQIGGALNERAHDDGAVGNRDARFVTGFNGTWMPGTPGDVHIDWVRSGWELIRPFSTGGNYVNFQVQDDDHARLAAAYGDNFARLRRVKAKYDPDNVFRVNRNISPAEP
jgi:FAD/FMN-containing dehydrogenase